MTPITLIPGAGQRQRSQCRDNGPRAAPRIAGQLTTVTTASGLRIAVVRVQAGCQRPPHDRQGHAPARRLNRLKIQPLKHPVAQQLSGFCPQRLFNGLFHAVFF